MVSLLSIPVLLITLMLQVAVVSRLPLLHGTADLMLVVLASWALQARTKDAWFWIVVGGCMITYVSATPAVVPLISYLTMAVIARFLKRMVWQAPIMAMLVVTLAGTLIFHTLTIIVLQLSGVGLEISETLSQVTMPSLLLNLLIALPIYLLITDASVWLYPAEMEI